MFNVSSAILHKEAWRMCNLNRRRHTLPNQHAEFPGNAAEHAGQRQPDNTNTAQSMHIFVAWRSVA